MADNFTNRFASGAAPQLVKNEPGDYQAFKDIKGAQRKPRFEVVTADGESHGFSWSYLGEWSLSPRGFLTFGTAGSVVTVEGRGLEHLHQLLLDEKLSGIYAFRPGIHQEPADDQPKITAIEVRGRFERPDAA